MLPLPRRGSLATPYTLKGRSLALPRRSSLVRVWRSSSWVRRSVTGVGPILLGWIALLRWRQLLARLARSGGGAVLRERVGVRRSSGTAMGRIVA